MTSKWTTLGPLGGGAGLGGESLDETSSRVRRSAIAVVAALATARKITTSTTRPSARRRGGFAARSGIVACDERAKPRLVVIELLESGSGSANSAVAGVIRRC